MRPSLLALAFTAISLTSAPASGDEQLRQQVEHQLQQHGVKVRNLDGVSDVQIAQIKLALARQSGPPNKRAHIRQILTSYGFTEVNDQLRTRVSDGLRSLGGSDIDPAALSGGQVAEIKLVLDDTSGEPEKRRKIDRILVRDGVPETASEQLRSELANCLRRSNFDESVLEGASAQQVPELLLVFRCGQEPATQRPQAELILGR